MGDHDRIHELISLSIDGALDAAGQRELQEHLAGCRECRELFELLTGVHAALDFEAEPPETLVTGVMEGVARINKTRGSIRVRRTGLTVSLAAAAAALALVFLPKTSDVSTEESGGEPAIASYSLEGEEDMPVAAIDGSGGLGVLRAVPGLPAEIGGTLEERCAGYRAVAWFSEIPPEISEAGSQVLFSDGTVGYDIPEELFERWSGEAVRIDRPDPDGEGIMAVAVPAED